MNKSRLAHPSEYDQKQLEAYSEIAVEQTKQLIYKLTERGIPINLITGLMINECAKILIEMAPTPLDGIGCAMTAIDTAIQAYRTDLGSEKKSDG